MGSRIANVSVILLAYIAFIPTVRNVIPPVEYFTLADGIITFNMMGTLVLMAYSFAHRLDHQAITFEDAADNTYFVFACIFFGCPFLVIIIMTLLHYVVWKS